MIECEMCGREINPTTDAYFQRIEGWARVRKDGGPNAITKPIRHGLFRCSTCLGGELEGQTQMFT